jgi:predicted RNA-binding Zn ribbon-like protein
MDTRPAWYPRAEPKPAPWPLLRVQAFVNTRDLEEGSDLLGEIDGARKWLVDAELLDPESSLKMTDLERAREVRESIRALLAADGGDALSGDLAPLRELADTHGLRLTVGEGGRLGLENVRRGELADGLFDLLLVIRDAQGDGTWSRLKVCGNPACRWAFYDRSRNQQGNWCEMAVCGNRLKNRNLRARRR